MSHHSCNGCDGISPCVLKEGDRSGGEEVTPERSSSKLCLAVVGNKGAEVVMFDVSGNPRTFAHKGDTRKLCFSTHGINADILTHCFDDDGLHGTPNEGCYCGLETPHLHAHVHDPKKCDSNHNENNGSIVPDSMDARAEELASLGLVTLHPVEPHVDGNGEGKQVIRIPVSEELPNQCNSSEMSRQMREYGFDPAAQTLRRRIHQIQHDDHVDYLVHDSSTGHLHLEHPNCNNCGQNDVHGLFKCVGKRSWGDATENRDVQVHFFETAPRPFSIIDFIHDLFDPNSRRVIAARPDPTHVFTESTFCTFLPDDTRKALNSVPEPPSTDGATELVVRSTFMCKGICCSSEVPMIRSVLNPLDGVERILVNVPLKQVLVDHDPSIITASGIESVLNKNRFGASVKADGGVTARHQMSSNGRSQFFVQHICCASEVPAINKIVQPIPGVTKVSISVPTKMVYVDHDTVVISAQQICDALNAQKFGASVKYDATKDKSSAAVLLCSSTLATQGGVPINPASIEFVFSKFDSSILESVNLMGNKIILVHSPLELPISTIIATLEADNGDVKYEVVVDGASSSKPRDESNDSETPLLPNIYVLFSGVFLSISVLSYIGHEWHYLKYVALLSIACGLPPIATKAFHTLLRYQFDTNCLMLFAILGAVALEDFVEGGAVTFLFGISEWMELRATSRARKALSAIVHLRPDFANLLHPVTNDIVVVPASSVPIGALVSVKPGDKVPCDGVVVEGTSTVDESSLTGESRPIRKAPEDEVSGGTINSGFTQLIVRTTSTAENSAVARLIRLVEEAQANRSQTEQIVEEFARFYTPLIVVGALIMCSIPWIHGRAAGKRWSHNGLVLMVVACPCALIISTPVAYVAGLAASAQKGILVKGGAHLESLGLVKRIAFDKTGTLTKGIFALLHLEIVSATRSRKDALEILSLMEERASHPLAQALLCAARNEGVSIPKSMSVLDHTFLPGEGVRGKVNGSDVYVGNERLFRRLGLFDSIPESIKQKSQLWASSGGTVGFMSVEGDGIVCVYCVADAVRPEAREVVEKLQRMKLNVTMLTGDNTDTALAIGEQIGLSESEIQSRLLPEQKLSIVNDMKVDRRSRSVVSNPLSKPCLVLMCGDGVNDAPALAAADVSVAMGAGAALAMETSDVTLLDSDLRKLVFSIEMGRRVIRKIKENIVFSVGIKLVVVVFALLGKTRLWAAIFSDVGAMIIVTLNGMSLLPRQREVKGNIATSGTHGGMDVEAFDLDAHEGSQPLIGDHRTTVGKCDHGCCAKSSACGTPDNHGCCAKSSGNHGCCEKPENHGCCSKSDGKQGCCGTLHNENASKGLVCGSDGSCQNGCCKDNTGCDSHCCQEKSIGSHACNAKDEHGCDSGLNKTCSGHELGHHGHDHDHTGPQREHGKTTGTCDLDCCTKSSGKHGRGCCGTHDTEISSLGIGGQSDGPCQQNGGGHDGSGCVSHCCHEKMPGSHGCNDNDFPCCGRNEHVHHGHDHDHLCNEGANDQHNPDDHSHGHEGHVQDHPHGEDEHHCHRHEHHCHQHEHHGHQHEHQTHNSNHDNDHCCGDGGSHHMH